MRLHAFILANLEPILAEWESYARSIWPDDAATPEELRDHAQEMLVSVATEMANPQNDREQIEKSLGRGEDQADSLRVDNASREHAESRSESGFDLRQLVAEYRALRSSVIRLWQKKCPELHSRDFEDVVRFNEAIDQLLAESVFTHTERIDQSREMFLGILGHDLRNPLSAVVGLAGLLRFEDLAPPSLELVSQITTHTSAMAKMIDDLLEFAAMRIASSFIISPAPMDLVPLCREAIAEIEAIYPNRVFQFAHSGDLTGEWDGSRLQQLLSNLLGNAAQHGAKREPISVAVEASAAGVVLAVSNQGAPIPADQIETIFEPMKRYAGGKGRGGHGGVGLGLFIAREVVLAHGGTIEAQSDERRTVFTVFLPRAARRDVQAGSPKAAAIDR